jgi:hypothetical protein
MSDEVIAYSLLGFSVFVVIAAIAAQFKKPDPAPVEYVCTECLTVGHKVRIVKGSAMVQLALFLPGVIPGLAYTVWRQSTVKHVCPACLQPTMIPCNTPRGRQLTKTE